MEISINEVLYIVLTVAVPVLLKYVIALIKSKINGWKYEQLCGAVLDAVEVTNQTYVDTLKENGHFSTEAQAEALERSLLCAKELMDESLQKWVVKVYGDMDKLLLTLIEAAVKASKKTN